VFVRYLNVGLELAAKNGNNDKKAKEIYVKGVCKIRNYRDNIKKQQMQVFSECHYFICNVCQVDSDSDCDESEQVRQFYRHIVQRSGDIAITKKDPNERIDQV
jgi:hypothetical protein